jgi:hypothetical protein
MLEKRGLVILLSSRILQRSRSLPRPHLPCRLEGRRLLMSGQPTVPLLHRGSKKRRLTPASATAGTEKATRAPRTLLQHTRHRKKAFTGALTETLGRPLPAVNAKQKLNSQLPMNSAPIANQSREGSRLSTLQRMPTHPEGLPRQYKIALRRRHPAGPDGDYERLEARNCSSLFP